jgi:uncharacterized protein (TIGR03437 family)
MLRTDWSGKPNLDVWNDLIFHQWWTDVSGTTGSDGVFRTRGFLGDYDIDIAGQVTPLSLTSHETPAYVRQGPATAGTISPGGVVNAATFQAGPVAPGEIVTIFGSGFGPGQLAVASYSPEGDLPRSAGDTRVLFDGVAAPMIYALNGQVSAIVPSAVASSTNIQVEYLGVSTPAVNVAVNQAAPGVFACAGKPGVPVVINASRGNRISCNDDFIPAASGDVITFFITGQGPVSPAIADGRLPQAPSFPAPKTPMAITIGGVPAPSCTATFIGMVYAGVTQINTCIPAGTNWSPGKPLTISSTGIAP